MISLNIANADPLLTAPEILAISTDAYLTRLNSAGKLGVAWLRVMVAHEMGLEPHQATRKWANNLEFDELRQPLESVARKLCVAAVEERNTACGEAFKTLQTHLRNAFDCVNYASARWFANKKKPLAPTKAYADSPFVSYYQVFARDFQGNPRMRVAGIGFKP